MNAQTRKFVCAGVTAICCACSVTPITAQVLINPGYEDGLNGWTYIPGSPSVPPIWDGSTFHSGTHSVALQQGDGGSNVYQTVSWNIPAGDTITEGFWFKMPNSEATTGKRLDAGMFAPQNNAIATSFTNSISVNDWTFQTLSLTTPVQLNSMTFFFTTQSGFGGPLLDFANVDEVSLADTASHVPEGGTGQLVLAVLAAATVLGRLTWRRRTCHDNSV